MDEKKVYTIKTVQKMQRAQTAPGELAIKSLPETVQKSLGELNAHIRAINYFVPDGKPNLEWRVSYASTLEEARRMAVSEAEHSADNILWRVGVSGVRDVWNLEYQETRETLINVAANNNRTKALEETRETIQGLTIDVVLKKARFAVWHEIKDTPLVKDTAQKKPAALSSMINLPAKAVTLDAVAANTLMARVIALSDIDYMFKATHTNHASRRMEVWEKGYCLAADINGILYVYCAAERPPEQLQMRI